jgi:hypothetical protein
VEARHDGIIISEWKQDMLASSAVSGSIISWHHQQKIQMVLDE